MVRQRKEFVHQELRIAADTVGWNLIAGERRGRDRGKHAVARIGILQCGRDSRKVAGPHGRRQSCGQRRGGGAGVEALEVRHEEQAVGAVEQFGDADWSAQRVPILILAVGRALGRGISGAARGGGEIVVARVQCVVAQKLKAVP